MSDIWYDDAMKAWEKDLPQMFTVPRHSLQQSVPAQGNNKENSLIFSDGEESEEDLLEDSKSDEVKKKAKSKINVLLYFLNILWVFYEQMEI